MPPREDTRTRRRELLRKARAELKASYADPGLGIDQLARTVGTSVRQLQRVFREEAGEDFRSYLLRVRMEQAASLLSRKTNPLPARVVATRVGYSRDSGLRQAFRRYHGINPSAVQPEPSEDLWKEPSLRRDR